VIKYHTVSSKPSSPKTKLKEQKMKKKSTTLFLCRAAIVAALYVALTYVSFAFGLASGVIQLRLSEALCILPLFLPEAIPGLAVGCMLANLFMGSALWDIIFGALATLIGAVGCYLLRRLPEGLKFLATLPTVIANALIIPPVLIFAYGAEEGYFFILATVTLGEILSAAVLGTVLYYGMKKSKVERFL
jgi:uncharacterized membrane protein